MFMLPLPQRWGSLLRIEPSKSELEGAFPDDLIQPSCVTDAAERWRGGGFYTFLLGGTKSRNEGQVFAEGLLGALH